MAERLLRLTSRGGIQDPGEVALMIASALSAVATVLDGFGAEAAGAAPARPQGDPAGGLAMPATFGKGRQLSKILVVDDDRFSAGLVDNVLRSASGLHQLL